MKNLIFFLGFILFSCSPSQDSVRLDEEKMAQILVDIHVNESKISAMNMVGSDSNLLMYHHLEVMTFKKHGIDSLTFVNSFNSYVKEPKDFIKLYARVKEIVDKREKKAETSHR